MKKIIVFLLTLLSVNACVHASLFRRKSKEQREQEKKKRDKLKREKKAIEKRAKVEKIQKKIAEAQVRMKRYETERDQYQEASEPNRATLAGERAMKEERRIEKARTDILSVGMSKKEQIAQEQEAFKALTIKYDAETSKSLDPKKATRDDVEDIINEQKRRALDKHDDRMKELAGKEDDKSLKAKKEYLQNYEKKATEFDNLELLAYRGVQRREREEQMKKLRRGLGLAATVGTIATGVGAIGALGGAAAYTQLEEFEESDNESEEDKKFAKEFEEE